MDNDKEIGQSWNLEIATVYVRSLEQIVSLISICVWHIIFLFVFACLRVKMIPWQTRLIAYRLEAKALQILIMEPTVPTSLTKHDFH